MDYRLDFITRIHPDGIELMSLIRKLYIELDYDLQEIQQKKPLSAAGSRALVIARTHLETSLQYAIKTLCLQYEIKE
jgi:hypothetical protein